jgi:hypothetical protein
LTSAALVAIVVAVAVLVEIVLPGRDIYHAGWYNVALVALVAFVAVAARRQYRRTLESRARAAILAIAFGTAILGFAAVACGLLAPDNQTVIGAPGQRVTAEDLGGSLVFPFTQTSNAQNVILERPGHGAVEIGAGARDVGSFILRTTLREVVAVDVRDLRGGRLTITQPTGMVFLSPVLLMQQRQNIAGMDLPYDSFSVPAAHRTVKAILFSPQEAAMLRSTITPGAPAVLFAVDDDEERPLPHAIALARDGQTLRLGGLLLRPSAIGYPSVEIVAVPSLMAVIVGLLVLVVGFVILPQRRHERSAA